MCLALGTASPGEGLKLLLCTTDTPSLRPRVPACPVNLAGPCLPWCPIPKKPLLHSGPPTLRRRRRFSLDQLPTVCPSLPPILPSPFLLARTDKTAPLQRDVQTPCSGAAAAFWCAEKTQNNSDFSLFSASQVPPL